MASLRVLWVLSVLLNAVGGRLIMSKDIYWTVPDDPLELLRCSGWECADHMAASNDGLLLFTGHGTTICVWTMPECTVSYTSAHCGETKLVACKELPGTISLLTLVADFYLAVAIQHKVYLWPLNPLALAKGDEPSVLTHSTNVVVLAHEGQEMVTGCEDGMVTMYWVSGAEKAEVTVSWKMAMTNTDGQPHQITAIALNRGGNRWLAVGVKRQSLTSRLLVWKLRSFQSPDKTPSFSATHISSILSIAFHPLEPWVYTGTRQGRLTTWHYTGQERHPIQQRGLEYPITVLEFSASGGFLLSGGSYGIAHLWDSDSARTVATFHYLGSTRSWTFSADEGFILANRVGEKLSAERLRTTGEDGVILAYPLDLRFPREAFGLGRHQVVGGPILASPNGFFLLDAHWERPVNLTLWDVRGRMTTPVISVLTNVSVVNLVHNPGTDSVFLGGNPEKEVSTPEEAQVQQWKVPWAQAIYEDTLVPRQLHLQGTYKFPGCMLSCVAVVAALRQFAVGCQDSTVKFVQIGDFTSRVVRTIVLPYGQRASSLAFHNRTLFVGTLLGAVCPHVLEEGSTQAEIQALGCQFPGDRIRVLRVTPDGAQVYSGGDNGRICRFDFQRVLGNISCFNAPGLEPRGVLSLELFENSTKLASSSINGALAVWDLTLPATLQQKPLEWFQSLDYYMTMTISPDGCFFYTTGTLGGISARYVDSVPAAVRRLKASPLCVANICTASRVRLTSRRPVTFPAWLEVTPLRYLDAHSAEIISMAPNPPCSMQVVNLSNATVRYWLSMGETWYSTPASIDLRDTDVQGVPILHGQAVRLVTDSNCVIAAGLKTKGQTRLNFCILRGPQKKDQLCATHFVSHDMSREALGALLTRVPLPRRTQIWVDHDDFPAWLCDCPAGRYGRNGTDCKLCKENHFCPSAGKGNIARNSVAQACPPRSGTMTTGLTNISECECYPGFYQLGSDLEGGPHCGTCPSGESTFAYGQTQCQSCSWGYRPLEREPPPPPPPPPGTRLLELRFQPLDPSQCYPDWYGWSFIIVLQLAMCLGIWGLQRQLRGLEIKDVALDRGHWVASTVGRRNVVIWTGVLDHFNVFFRSTGNPFLDFESDSTREQPDSVRALSGAGGLRMVLLRKGLELDGHGPRLDTSRGFVHFRGPWLWLLSGRYVPNVVSVPLLLAAANLLLQRSHFRKYWLLFGLSATSVVGLIWLALLNFCSSRPAIHYLLKNFSRQLTKPTPVPRGPERAIRLESILELQEQFRFIIGDRDMYYVTSNILHPLTKPPLAKGRFSYAEVVGPMRATFFVSHYWGMPFEHSVKSLSKHAQLADHVDFKQTAYWVCSFAINQHCVEDELGDGDLFESSFYLALVDKRTRATVMLLDDEATPLTRVWCLFEVLQTFILSHKQEGFQGLLLCTPSGVLNQSTNVSVDMAITVARRLTHLRLEDAKASKPADKQTIDDLVSSYEGGHEAMNAFVRENIHHALKRIKKQHNQTFDHLMRELQHSEQTGRDPRAADRRAITMPPASVSGSKSRMSSRGIRMSAGSSEDEEVSSSDEDESSAGENKQFWSGTSLTQQISARLGRLPSSLLSMQGP